MDASTKNWILLFVLPHLHHIRMWRSRLFVTRARAVYVHVHEKHSKSQKLSRAKRASSVTNWASEASSVTNCANLRFLVYIFIYMYVAVRPFWSRTGPP